MDRGTPYVICDTDNTPLTPALAKAIIASTGRCPRRSAAGGAAGRGRPLSKSTRDMSQALEAQRGDLPPHRPVLDGTPGASSQPSNPLDTPSS